MSGYPQSTVYLCQRNWYIWKSIPLKRFDENTAVYGISGILPSTSRKMMRSKAADVDRRDHPDNEDMDQTKGKRSKGRKKPKAKEALAVRHSQKVEGRARKKEVVIKERMPSVRNRSMSTFI